MGFQIMPLRLRNDKLKTQKRYTTSFQRRRTDTISSSILTPHSFTGTNATVRQHVSRHVIYLLLHYDWIFMIRFPSTHGFSSPTENKQMSQVADQVLLHRWPTTKGVHHMTIIRVPSSTKTTNKSMRSLHEHPRCNLIDTSAAKFIPNRVTQKSDNDGYTRAHGMLLIGEGSL